MDPSGRRGLFLLRGFLAVGVFGTRGGCLGAAALCRPLGLFTLERGLLEAVSESDSEDEVSLVEDLVVL